MFVAAALFLAAMGLAAYGLRRAVRQDRFVRTLSDKVMALEVKQAQLRARQDRLQNMVVDRGWRDSMMLTTIDWRNPPKKF